MGDGGRGRGVLVVEGMSDPGDATGQPEQEPELHLIQANLPPAFSPIT